MARSERKLEPFRGSGFGFVLAAVNIANLGTGRHPSERERNSLSDASKISSKLARMASMAANFFLCFWMIFGLQKYALNLAFETDSAKMRHLTAAKGCDLVLFWRGRIWRI